jgi:hypothetical protein
MRRLWMAVMAAALVAALAGPASAITRGGTLDGEDHPYVGLFIAEVDGAPAWRCSGALISPTVFVTAGHCTIGADGAQLWFETDVQNQPGRAGYPFEGEVTGTPFTFPPYDDDAFYLYDLGVVVLDDAVELDRYASLPAVGELDTLDPGRKRATVTAVGYGLQGVVPELQAELTRYRADLMVVDTTGVVGMRQTFADLPGTGSFTVSGDAAHGGTCFGDSGGPMLIGDTIVGVNSFGLNANCAGVGGAYRIDKATDLEWIEGFVD